MSVDVKVTGLYLLASRPLRKLLCQGALQHLSWHAGVSLGILLDLTAMHFSVYASLGYVHDDHAPADLQCIIAGSVWHHCTC